MACNRNQRLRHRKLARYGTDDEVLTHRYWWTTKTKDCYVGKREDLGTFVVNVEEELLQG